MNLRNLNLSSIEEKILRNLIYNEDQTVKNLVETLNHDKKVIYENTRKLLLKGLISETIKLNIRHYNFSGIESIKSIIEKNKESQTEEEDNLNELIKEINKVKPKKESIHENSLLYGKSGVRTLLNELLTSKEYLIIGAPKSSEEIMGGTFWHNFHRKQEQNKIKAKMIFNSSLKGWRINNKNLKVKYFNEIEPMTETIIFNDTVGIIVWSEEPTTTIIKNRKVADSYKEYFELLWKKAKD